MKYGFREPRKRPDKIILFAFCLLLTGAQVARAQTDSTQTDSSARASARVKLFFNFDARGTFIQQKHINVFGVNAGITFGEKRNRITAGYYWLGYNAARRLVNWRRILSNTLNLSYYTATDVRFVNFAYWHTAIRNKRWVLSTPLEIGIGNESTRFRDLFDGITSGSRKDYFIPLQVGVYGEYRALRWAGVNSQLGYRNALSSGGFRERFSGFYYSYGINLYPEAIWKDFRKWSNRKPKSQTLDHAALPVGH
ncbi:hypothetical protein GCM10010967_45290 [Dyadobacter beijingensis]|uniref:DUF2490 domain-containing protein n=1 Tax=Dyadobacter beijingensis TaxID=365489 RepID=A0ABQ2IDC5_9BACT|nr:hypothetical protein [Dyadobacter beijingensis]GGN05114.1 hypothetical protein GCM10010967_45290 [Dyadobacter beijingensis]